MAPPERVAPVNAVFAAGRPEPPLVVNPLAVPRGIAVAPFDAEVGNVATRSPDGFGPDSVQAVNSRVDR